MPACYQKPTGNWNIILYDSIYAWCFQVFDRLVLNLMFSGDDFAGQAIPGAKVEIKLEIDADVPDGIDRAKQRTLTENGNTLGFTDNSIK